MKFKTDAFNVAIKAIEDTILILNVTFGRDYIKGEKNQIKQESQ